MPTAAYPVLAYLDRIDGVTVSSVNGSGTRIRLALRPGADPKKVAGAVRRVLNEQTKDLVPVPLAGAASTAALRQEQWREKSQLAEVVASETTALAHRSPMLLITLFLVWLAVGLVLLWWQSRRRRAGNPEPGSATNHP